MDYITKIQRSIDFIEKNITGDLELNEIAKEACFSLFHFHRIFFILTGNSVKDYKEIKCITQDLKAAII